MKKYYVTIKSLQILIFALSILFCSAIIAGATQYYVSTASGNDTNPGTSVKPFQTIQKCANVTQAGDTCNINSGTYREMVTIANSGSAGSPITFTAGTGQTVTISGANVVTGWTQYSGNIYVANVGTITAPTQLYVDGQFYDIAHYPNSGYLIATSNSSDLTSIIDSNLALTPAQTVGATVVTRVVPWAISTTIATNYDSTTGTITLNAGVYGTNNQAMRISYGFYLQNMLWMLTAPGEWFYDSTAGRLYLWTASSDNPSNHTIEVSNRSYGISDYGKNYVTIQNIAIANANQYDLSVNNANNVTLNNISMSGGQMGIQSYSLTNSTVQNNSVQNTLADGMSLSNLSNLTISNNTINNAGNMGIPKQSDGGLLVGGTNSNVSITSNTITNSGYDGIAYYGDQTMVQNNIIDKSCLVLDDCGGIYTSDINSPTSTSTISGNTVTNSIGNFSGTAYTNTQAEGIYLDDLSHGYTVSNNTVSNVNFGIYVHTGYNNTLTGNKVYSARIYGLYISEDNFGGLAAEVAGAVHNNVVTGNIFETIANSTLNYWAGSGVADYYSEFETIANFGTFNNNQYCHPNISYVVGENEINPQTNRSAGANYTLPNWQAASGQDLNSTDTSSYCDPQLTLTLTNSGTGLGAITSTPAGISCPSTCSATFNSGASVLLTAVANSGSVFTGWSGACSGTGSCSVTMNSPQSVTANFNNTAGMYGDVSGDGKVTIYDAELTMQYALGLINLTPAQISLAEVNGGGNVTVYDAELIAQYALGLITKFPVQS